MSEKTVASYLRKWGFPDLVDEFQDNNVTIDHLKRMDFTSIGKLIPDIERYIEFLNKWKCDSDLSSTSSDSSDSCHSSSVHETESIQTSSTTDAVEESEDDEENEETVPVNRDRKRKMYSTQSEYRKRIKRSDSQYLTNLLNSHNFGKALIIEYKNNKILSDESSILLCDIIVSDLIVDYESHLSNNDFSDLADEIKTIFPNESTDTYYIAPKPKRESEKNVSEHSRGRLVDKFHNKLQRYRKMTGYKRSTLSRKERNIPVNFSAEVKKSLVWLEHNSIFEEVVPHWKITSIARYKLISSTNGTVADILNKYRILNDPKFGHQLIDIDFDKLYPLNGATIYEIWQELFEKLWTAKCAKKCPQNMQLLKNALMNEKTTQHSKEFIQILLLAHLITPRCSVKVRNSIFWKPSVEESKDGVAIFLQTGADIEEVHRQKVDRMYEMGLTVQPYIIGVGNELADVKNFYIMVDTVRYRFDSPLKALDICFKIFLTWYVNFPVESQQVWLFIQYAIYQLKTDRDIIKPHVNKILQAINVKIPKTISEISE